MTTAIKEFKGEYHFLSNFHLASVFWEHLHYPSAEHAYQAAKTKDEEERFNISELPTPGLAKRVGQKLTLRPDWEEVKFDIMLDIVRAKFTQNTNLYHKLLETGNAILEEGNHWGDIIWGISPAYGNIGENKLGKILMQVRSELVGQ